MSDNPAILVGSRLATRFELHVPNVGPWYADIDFDEDVEGTLTGRQTITSGDVTLVGTVPPEFSGSFIGRPTIRIVGGGGGWGRQLPRKAYHNDAGVKTRTVALETAAACGESLGTFVPESTSFGPDYCRVASPASKVLEDCAGVRPWRVKYDGTTEVGIAPTTKIDPEIARVIDPVDTRAKLVTLGLDSLAGVSLGMQITDSRLDSTYTVREFEVAVTSDSMTAKCWCGGSEDQAARLPRLFRQIARRALDAKIPGRWRFRVVDQMSDGRLALQAVDRNAGIPDQILTPQQMGAPGITATLKAGTQVLVEFLDGGNPALPCVTGYAAEGDNHFVPSEMIIGKRSTAAKAATEGDTVRVLLPPMVFTGTIGGSPASGVVTALTGSTLGIVETTKVQDVLIG